MSIGRRPGLEPGSWWFESTYPDHFMNTFKLSNEQIVKVNEWMSKHVAQYTGAIGGRYTYSFCPTTLGVLVKITDSVTNEILDVTEYDGW